MSIRETIAEKLAAAGVSMDALINWPASSATAVLCVVHDTAGKVSVIRIPSYDGAVYFDGMYCPFDGLTLLIERSVAVEWGLMAP